ncbi:MAG: right-handed parallel beta-helix repeat-containing protein [Krumholzibacteria bacterium]|nr:right-handed parallel beta-helix repeat-containing protein [Candidatus Krumholzibacteria bacterium]
MNCRLHTMLRIALALAAAVATAGPAEARTWQVAKSGERDFAVIQDAVDAAASGDTIMIGPGRYEEFTWITLGNFLVYVEGRDKDMTIIGAGIDETIIGHENPPFPDNVGTTGIIWRGSGVALSVRGLTLDNLQAANGFFYDGRRLEIDDFAVRNCYVGINLVAREGGWIRNCEFETVGYDSTDLTITAQSVIVYEPTVDFVIEQCTFVDCGIGVGAYWDFTDNIAVQYCSFRGGKGGVDFNSGASGTIRHCTFFSQYQYGIVGSFNDGATLVIEDNTIVADHPAGKAYGFSLYWPRGTYTLRRNTITAANGNACIWVTVPNAVFDARDNHFLRADTTSFLAKGFANPNAPGAPFTIDATGNWWGTTDPAEIAAGILDLQDDPALDYRIVFEPFLGGPVPVRNRSLGGVKALFR